MTQISNKPEWPFFSWSSSALLDVLVTARFEQGRLLSLPTSFVHSFEILEKPQFIYQDLLLKAQDPLTLERLHGWQASLFPTGYSGVKKIKIGEFRTKDLLPEITKFLNWWSEPPVELDPVLRSAITFIWFYIISPYEDGNFILAQALTELALQQAENTPTRTYDVALQLEENNEILIKKIETCVNEARDITEWILFYLELYTSAINAASIIADKNQSIDLFWKNNSQFDLNQRQRKILNHLLENPGPINNREYVKICKTSRESAKRDLSELVKLKILILGDRRGRSISYSLRTQASVKSDSN